MTHRRLTAKHAKYAKRRVEETDLHVRRSFFRVFRVFRGSRNFFRPSQSLVTSIATLLELAARTTSAQSQDDVPPLLAPLNEIPATVWEQHGLLIVVLGSLGIVVVVAAIWWVLQPKPTVPVPIEIQTRNELELLQLPAEDGKTVSRISQALKHYFVVAFDLPSSEMTTTEFNCAFAASENAGSDLAADVSDFHRQCDERKFSPSAGVQASACSRALELLQQGEARRAELRQEAKPQ